MDLKELTEVYTGARSESGVVVEDRPPPTMRLRPKHLRVVALHVAGWTNFEVGSMVGLAESTVSKIINHPMLQEYKAELSEKVARETLLDARILIQNHTMEAGLKLVEHMRGENIGVSFRAVQDILDRGGVPRAEILQATSLLLDTKELEDLRTALDDIQVEVEEVKEVEESHAVLARMRESGELTGDKDS